MNKEMKVTRPVVWIALVLLLVGSSTGCSIFGQPGSSSNTPQPIPINTDNSVSAEPGGEPSSTSGDDQPGLSIRLSDGQAVPTVVETLEPVRGETLTEEQFTKYENMILGVPTWFDGELPNYWDEFVPALEDLDLKGKKVAIYGAGDQKGYPENFVDGIGIMAQLVEQQGAKLVGFTSTKGYTFESSKAQREDRFAGLALDFENQVSMNKDRIASWCEQLKKEFH
jgi:flavodoxin I